MNTIREPGREIPVVDEVDLAVVGGSCTGVFAAVRAARLGLRVAVVEKQNCFGGVATAGNVNIWHSLHDTIGERQIIGGLTQEILDRLSVRNAVLTQSNPSPAYRINTEELKIEIDDLVVGHGIVPYLHSFYAAPVVEDGTLAAVILENKNGRGAIRARQFIDATGDADLALDLNLPSFKPETLQPPTLCAKIKGMNSLGDFDWQDCIRQHGAEFGLDPDWGWGSPIPGLPDIQMRADSHVFNCDTSDGDQLSHAEIEGRRQVRALMDLIRKYGPPHGDIALVDLAAVIGARETRRIVASYRLTGDDVLKGRPFEDAIANGSYRVDIHHADGPGITFRYLDGTEVVIPERGADQVRKRWRDPVDVDPTCYQIPWRCLLQNRISNLVLAGRMLDADKMAFSAARVMVNMNQTGEAAGVACALAIKEDIPIQSVDTRAIRETLAQGGSIIMQ
ncbi:MAG: FAD-dependent oxidoreductase [Verrucomicrobiota bacterium]